MKILTLAISVFFSVACVAQDGFVFTSDKKKVSIPFKLINNLIIIPIKVNGVPLSFLLDTGVEETILFSLEESEEVVFKNVEKITLKGLGNAEPIEGLKSTSNTLSIKSLVGKEQQILIVLDQTFNFSSNLGIPVNGIIGYQLFRNNFIEIDYKARRLHIYNLQKVDKNKLTRRFSSMGISVEKSKPYTTASVNFGKEPFQAKLLIDTGNSESFWMFQNKSDKIAIPSPHVNDFLGRGFSGDIFGDKGRIAQVSLDKFEFHRPIVSFPDTLSIKNVKMVRDRLGSVGGEILRRFTLIFDYQDNRLYLKKNNDFNDLFHYNMSGIVLHHAGLQWVKEGRSMDRENTNSVKINFGDGEGEHNIRYRFELKPVYVVSDVREDSPAGEAGIKKGDIIVKINDLESYRFTLQQINEMLKSGDGKTIEIEVDRNNLPLKFKIRLKSVL